MQPIEHDLPGSETAGGTADELRRENQELRRQILHLTGASQGSPHAGPPTKLWNPSRVTIWSIALLVVVALVLAFFAGYIPLRKRNAINVSEAQQQENALPRMDVVQVSRSARNSEMELPG